MVNLNHTFRANRLVGTITIAAPPNTGLGCESDCKPFELGSPAAPLIFGIDAWVLDCFSRCSSSPWDILNRVARSRGVSTEWSTKTTQEVRIHGSLKSHAHYMEAWILHALAKAHMIRQHSSTANIASQSRQCTVADCAYSMTLGPDCLRTLLAAQRS